MAGIGEQAKSPKRYVELLTKLALLAPRIVEAVDVRGPTDLNLQTLIDGRPSCSPEWKSDSSHQARAPNAMVIAAAFGDSHPPL